MKLSDAIEKGTYGMHSHGPGFVFETDPYRAAFRGVHDRDPSHEELAVFYHAEGWGFPSDAEYALRICATFRASWRETIVQLRQGGL